MDVLKATFPLQATGFKIKTSFLNGCRFGLNLALYFSKYNPSLKVVLLEVVGRHKADSNFMLSYFQL